jgi:predicted sugar kinase
MKGSVHFHIGVFENPIIGGRVWGSFGIALEM